MTVNSIQKLHIDQYDQYDGIPSNSRTIGKMSFESY